jgi:hypothetical protein
MTQANAQLNSRPTTALGIVEEPVCSRRFERSNLSVMGPG